MGLRSVAVAALLAAAAVGCSALWVRGTLATQNELTLVAQFAFSSSTESVGLFTTPLFLIESLFHAWTHAHTCTHTGTVLLDTQASAFVPGRSFWVLYNDSAASWRANHGNASRSCLDKMRAAAHAVRVTQYLNRTLALAPAPQPHLWYLALLVCPDSDATTPVRLAFAAHFLDGGTRELGADTHPLLPLTACALAASALLLAAACAAVCARARRSSAPTQPGDAPTAALALALLCAVLALASVAVHWALCAHDGTGVPALRRVGLVVLAAACALLGALLLALARGSRSGSRRAPAAFAVVLAAIDAALFLASPGDSLAAVLASALAWAAPGLCVVWCLARAPGRSVRVCVLAALWFAAVPACRLAALAAPAWRQPFAAALGPLACAALVCTSLVAALWPRRPTEAPPLLRVNDHE